MQLRPLGDPEAVKDDGGMTTLLITALFWMPTTAAIYRCQIPGEPVTFADRPCRNGVVVELQPTTTVSITPLTDAQRQQLDDAARANRERAEQRQKQLARTRARLEEDVRRAARACQDARQGLEALKLRKRKGYSLADSVRLAGRADELRETIRDNCS